MEYRKEWIAAGYDQWPHFVRLDCDWDADGLWNERGAMYRLDGFPISADLQSSIAAWQELYNGGVPEELTSEAKAHRHVAIGTMLARRLKRERPRCIVVALQHRIRDDLSVGEAVPFPGEYLANGEPGSRFLDWRNRLLAGQFRR